MKLKMKDATTDGGADLCATCRHFRRTRFALSGEEMRVCTRSYSEHPIRLNGPVAECSAYEDKRAPTLYSMEQIAWHISTDKRTGKAGFLDPKQYEKAKKDNRLTDEAPSSVTLPDGDVYHFD